MTMHDFELWYYKSSCTHSMTIYSKYFNSIREISFVPYKKLKAANMILQSTKSHHLNKLGSI